MTTKIIKKIVPFFIFSLFLIVLLSYFSFANVLTFHVQETDLVKVMPKAIDPDNDNIVYQYSAPLNKNGEWQTGFDDAGEYNLEIIASDGNNQTVKKIKLIVDNKNRSPAFTANKVTVNETQKIDLKELIYDPDNDALTYLFKSPFDNNGQWQTDYNDSGNFVTIVEVSDGEFKIENKLEITVLNSNQPPRIVDSFSAGKIFEVKENENFTFFVTAKDDDLEDQDGLAYQWFLDDNLIGEEKEGAYFFDFNSAGSYDLKLIVSDGRGHDVLKKWTIKVREVNQAPKLSLSPLTVNEGEKVYLDLPEVDDDKDELTYSFEAPLDENGEWQTDFNSADTYNLKVTVSDGQIVGSEIQKIIVQNIDRAPTLNVPAEINLKEGEVFVLEINSSDYDQEDLEITLENLPDWAVFDEDEQVITFNPGYDVITRRFGALSDFLNAVRLEHYFLKEQDFSFTINSCSKEKCTSADVLAKVLNTNLPPQIQSFGELSLDELSFSETEKIKLNAEVFDPDGDIVRTTFSDPVGKFSGEWKTDDTDEGIYTLYAAVTDGELTTTVPVNLTINKKNNLPKFEIDSDKLVINEGDELAFSVGAEDVDADSLEIKLKNLPKGASFSEGIFKWQPLYNFVINQTDSFWNNLASKNAYLNKKINREKETVWLEFAAFDGEAETVHPVEVIVKNVNQKPQFVDAVPIESVLSVAVGQELTFQVSVKDDDSDVLNYEWDFGCLEEKVSGIDINTVKRIFTSPGEKKVKVTVSDGRAEIIREWTVNVFGEEIAPEDVETENVNAGDVKTEEKPFSIKVYYIDQ